jgi:hypothetical protein
MYTVDVKVKGVSPMLQHRFPRPDFESLGRGGHKHSGATDYTDEWKNYMYVNASGEVYQRLSTLSRL